MCQPMFYVERVCLIEMAYFLRALFSWLESHSGATEGGDEEALA